jgi:hypothetical protein
LVSLSCLRTPIPSPASVSPSIGFVSLYSPYNPQYHHYSYTPTNLFYRNRQTFPAEQSSLQLYTGNPTAFKIRVPPFHHEDFAPQQSSSDGCEEDDEELREEGQIGLDEDEEAGDSSQVELRVEAVENTSSSKKHKEAPGSDSQHKV